MTETPLAWAQSLVWRGIFQDRVTVVDAWRSGALVHVRLHWLVPHTSRPTDPFPVVVNVPLDPGKPDTWPRVLLEQFADVLGHELGESVHDKGRPLADPHAVPRVWPWRVADRENP